MLEALYRQLVEDVETEGTLIASGQAGAMKGNPSAALLVRVIAELDRREAARAVAEMSEEVIDENDLGAVLRSVG